MNPIRHVHLFTNGMVAVFDEQGEQLPQYQGRAAEVAARILHDAPECAEFFVSQFRGWNLQVKRERWGELVREFFGAAAVVRALRDGHALE